MVRQGDERSAPNPISTQGYVTLATLSYLSIMDSIRGELNVCKLCFAQFICTIMHSGHLKNG